MNNRNLGLESSSKVQSGSLRLISPENHQISAWLVKM
jgi:hypothetical protein